MGAGMSKGFKRRTSAALLAITSMVAGLLLVIPERQAAAAEPKQARDLQAGESEQPRPDRPEIPKGDFGDLPSPKGEESRPKKDWSKSFDKEKSKLAKREAKADIFENPDGTKTAVLATDEINWKDAKGDWHRIDPKLVDDGAGGWRNASGPVKVKLPGTTGDGPLAALEGEGWSIVYRLEGAKHGVKAKTKDAKATYDDLLPGVDVEEQALPKGVKDLLVLEAAPAHGADAVFRFPLELQGLTPGAGEDGSVVFRDAAGHAVVESPATISWDADDSPAEGERVVTPLGLVQDGDAWVLEVRVPGSWLADPSTAYPVTIDPTLDAGRNTAQYDAFASSFPGNQDTNYNGGLQWDPTVNRYVDMVGYDLYPDSQQYTYQYFDLSPVMNKVVYYGEWRDWTYLTKGFAHDPGWEGYYRLWPVAADWNQSSIRWNNLPNHRPEYAEGFADANTTAWQDITDWVDAWASGEWPSKGIAIDSAGLPSGVRFAASEDGDPTRPYLYVTYNERPVISQPIEPFDGATVIQDQPTFSATTGADDNPLRHLFRVSTQPDGTGTLVESGWLTFAPGTNPSWTPPKGVFVNGTTYYWSMATDDGVYGPQWSEPDTFRFDLRLGEQSAMPTDGVSGVTVNLATGNAHARLSSPSFDTVGGAMGIDYSYNSRVPQRYAATPQHIGLMGTYTDDTDGSRRLVRRDRQLDFNWSSGSPGGRIGTDQFRVSWTGYVTVPTSGAWTFGAAHDDQVTVTVNGTTVLDTGCCSGGPRWGSSVNLTAGQTVPITVSMYEAVGAAYLQLWTKGPGTSPDGFVVPSDWLSTVAPGLPAGWSMSADGLDGLAYTSLDIGDTAMTLTGADGTAYPYVRQADLSWKPTGQADDVLTTVVEGGKTTYVVHADDGVDYTFDDAGRLVRAATTADDNRKPAAAEYDYDASTGRLEGLVDPLTSRRIDLDYAAAGVACPTNSTAGLTEEPPVGMLCQVKYWSGTDPAADDTRAKTSLYYLQGRLARIEDPGGEVTDFGYDADSRLNTIRSPEAADMAAALGSSMAANVMLTRLHYDAAGRIARVVAPPAEVLVSVGGSIIYPLRAEHSYEYDIPNRYAKVHVAGLTEPNGYARRVKWDLNGWLEEDYDTAGLMTRSYKDASGLAYLEHERKAPGTEGVASSTVYDHAGRPVEQYGPAPAACFSIFAGLTGWNRPPGYTGARPHCPAPVTTTAYDESAPGIAIKGLAASYWDTPNLSGSAVSHATGVGHGDGSLSKDWGTAGKPEGATSADNWSARFTGEIRFATARTYTLRLCADDGVRLFVDDAKLIDDWRDTAYTCREANVVADRDETRKRIRVDYYERTGDARIDLLWRWSGVGDQLVPGANLAPRYGLATTTTDADGKKVFTEYGRPEYGQASATRVDPAGLDLRSTTEYEAPGEGYLRRKWRTMPKGPGGATDPTKTSYSYYVTGEVAPANDCGGTASNGMLKRATGADPAGAQGPIVHEVVYDAWNRVLGKRVVGDPRWSCTTRDLRGRITSSTDSSNKTTTVTYSTPGEVTTAYVDSSGTSRTTVEKFDLLGRSWSYTDEHGTTTRRTFDQAGRAKEVFRKFSGETEMKIQEFAYTNENRLASTTEYVSGGPRTTTYAYDSSTGKPTTTTRPNGVVTTTGYNADTGRLSSMNHTKGATRLSNWGYGRNASGDVTSESLVSDVAAGRNRTYGYDAAGRLITVTEGAATRRYAYDANGNRCARAANCAAPEYTYDDADRIQSSPGAASYEYDGHGNVVAQTSRSQGGTGTFHESWDYDANTPTPHQRAVEVDASGTVSATLNSATPTYATGSPSGTLAPSATWSTPIKVRGRSYLKATVQWNADGGSLASVTARFRNAAGTTAKTATGSSGSLTLVYEHEPQTPATETFTVQLVNNSGTLSAPYSVTWSATTVSKTDVAGSLNPGQTATTSVTADGNGHIAASVAYPKGLRPATMTDSRRVNSSNEKVFVADAPGRIDASLAFTTPQTYQSNSYSVPLAPGATWTTGVTGQFGRTTFARFTANDSQFRVSILGAAGTTVSTATGGPSGATASWYEGGDTPSSHTIELKNTGPVSATASLEVHRTTVQVNGITTGTVVAPGATWTRTLNATQAGDVSAQVESTEVAVAGTQSRTGSVTSGDRVDSVSVPVQMPGPVSGSLDWQPTTGTVQCGSCRVGPELLGMHGNTVVPVSADGTVTAGLTWPQGSPVNPDLALVLLDPDGNEVARSDSSSGTDNSERIEYSATGVTYPQVAQYTARVLNKGLTEATYSLSVTHPRLAQLELALYSSSGLKKRVTGTKPLVLDHDTTADQTDWSFRVTTADGADASYALTMTYPTRHFAPVTATIRDSAGTAVATGSGAGQRLWVRHHAPAAGAYTLEVQNTSAPGGSSAPLWGASHTPKSYKPDLDLELWSQASGTWAKVAQGANTPTANPETLSYDIPAGATGSHKLVVVTRNYPMDYTLTATHPTIAYADVVGRVKNAAGQVVATGTATNGSLSVDYLAPEPGGQYTFELQNTSDGQVPSYVGSVRAPQRRLGDLRLELKDSTGAVIATATNSRPWTVSSVVQPGSYNVVATPLSGDGTADLDVGYPTPARHLLTYDANDHATSVDDGATTISETLAPSGRVIRRVVKDVASQVVLEDTIFGYADGSDTPTYSRPTSGGTVTTYLDGVIYTGTTAAWQLANDHGDIVGTTDAAGTFTPVPLADEFGVGEPPASRLGWLGNHERFNVGGNLRLVRMGVRLYDPSLGRFLQVDPVEDGSANDYDYVNSDPINSFDLDGRLCLSLKCAKRAAALVGRGVARGARAAGEAVVRNRKALTKALAIVGAGTCAVATGGIGAAACLYLAGAAIAASTATKCYNVGACRTGAAHRKGQWGAVGRHGAGEIAAFGAGLLVGKAFGAIPRGAYGRYGYARQVSSLGTRFGGLLVDTMAYRRAN